MADVRFQDIYNTVRIPLIQAPEKTISPNTYNGTQDQCFLNCIPMSTPDPLTGQKEAWVVKRPGLNKKAVNFTSILGAVNSCAFANIVISQLNDIYIAGIYDSTNSKMVIIQYRPITGTTVKIGEITGATGFDQLFLSELTIANVATLGVVWNHQNGTTSKGYYATSSGGLFTASSLTEIVDVDFPPKAGSPLPLVGPMVQMNGTTYVLTNTGIIAGSDLNSITSWNSLNQVQAISYPDQGCCLLRYKSHIIAFGEDSMEFFSDVGNPAPVSPLQRQEQAFIKFGAPHAKAVCSVDDVPYWLARSSSGSIGLWKLDGYTPVKLSNPIDDQLLDGSSLQSGEYCTQQLCPISFYGQKNIIVGGTYMRSGLYFAAQLSGDLRGFTGGINQGTMVYNIPENLFWGLGLASGFGSTYSFPMAVSEYNLRNTSAGSQYFIIGAESAQSGMAAGVYTLDPTSYFWTDTIPTGTRVPYLLSYQCNRMMANNSKKKRVHKITWVIDNMFSDALEDDSGSTLWFLYTKDDWTQGSSAGTTKNRSITIPNTFNRYYVNNLGSSRNWGFGVVSGNKMAMRIKSLELDVSQGSQ